ncbi:MAG: hypothetical protein N2544_15155 [Burkholderiales bacterium]|nr:hypothetical protein [Burkholderiales bacterium]
MTGLLARLRAIGEEPWPAVSAGALAGTAAFAAFVLGFAHTGERWVWILDSANLAFHEAGHPIAGLLSGRLAVYGGTLAQLAFPAAVTASFWVRRHPASFAVAAIWLGENLLNVATYMADARALQLPLVGGLDPQDAHDWREILSRWGLLRWDTTLAFVVRIAGWATILGALGWLAARWRAGREGD